ncbi:GntR family transcriptional regulator [Companilactobacillus metriopterae]|uniref:GntR family transcriptional regulator n=1 Tax=Companilactobacillus metriopterae TaxID=1909267 RepID=UPI0013E9809C|nr:GntR family transcriptional regulator [Companilactobacillus metriopterae]
MPKYNEVVNSIQNLIQKENLKQGDKLPSLAQMIDQFKTSKTTIVKALDILQKNGTVYQVHGSGIFVRRSQKNGLIDLYTNSGFTSDLEKVRLEASDISISSEIPNNEVSKNLNCKPGEEVFHISRLRSTSDEILCIENSYLKKTLVPYINKEVVEESIFNYLFESYNLEVGFSDKYLSVSKLSDKQAKLLNLKKDDPCLITNELFYSTNGEPFDYSTNIYNYKNANFFLQITNN